MQGGETKWEENCRHLVILTGKKIIDVFLIFVFFIKVPVMVAKFSFSSSLSSVKMMEVVTFFGWSSSLKSAYFILCSY